MQIREDLIKKEMSKSGRQSMAKPTGDVDYSNPLLKK